MFDRNGCALYVVGMLGMPTANTGASLVGIKDVSILLQRRSVRGYAVVDVAYLLYVFLEINCNIACLFDTFWNSGEGPQIRSCFWFSWSNYVYHLHS